jgi:hypothetical protein
VASLVENERVRRTFTGLANARSQPADGPRRRRRRRIITVAAGLALTATLFVVHPWGHGQPRNVFFLPPSSLPTGYHVVYVEGAPAAATSTEELWVRRPFESADETRSGPPPGETLVVSTVSRLGHQILRSGSAAQGALVNVPVTAAPADVRLDAVYTAARDAHLLQYRRDDVVAGRHCRVVRSAHSLRSPPLIALGAHPRSYVDTCVDNNGLILREQTVRDGALAMSRTAVSVVAGPAAGNGGAYAVSALPIPSDQGGGSITQLTPDSLPPGRTWVLAKPPAGFTLRGRFVVVPPQQQAFGSGTGGAAAAPGAQASPVILEDVYVRGPDVLVVERGTNSDNARFAPPTGGRPVDLGRLGAGQLVLAATASSVVAEPAGESNFVRVTGTVDPRLLLQTARSLVSVDMGGRNTLVTIPSAVP